MSRTWTDAAAGFPPLSSLERTEVEALAKDLATDMSGAFLGSIKPMAQLCCELGAERDRALVMAEQFQAFRDTCAALFDRELV